MFRKISFNEKHINDVIIGLGVQRIGNMGLDIYTFISDGVLIDTGAKTLKNEFMNFFKNHEIEQAVITHHHEDHTGCAKYIIDELGLPVFINENGIDLCKKRPKYPLYRKIYSGIRKPFNAQSLDQTITSKNATWDVIATPGHTDDHVAFLNRNKGQLFTGDLYVQEKTKLAYIEESIPTIIDSLQKVLTYDFEEVFCAHSGYVNNGKGKIALQRKLDYLINLEGEILRLYGEGLAPKEIQERLLYNKYPIVTFSFGEWDALYIVTSILNDHDKLIAE